MTCEELRESSMRVMIAWKRMMMSWRVVPFCCTRVLSRYIVLMSCPGTLQPWLKLVLTNERPSSIL